MDPTREKLTGCALAAGALLMLGSGFLGYLFLTSGMYQVLAGRDPASGAVRTKGDLNLLPLVLFFFMIGLALCIGAVVYGLIYNKRQTSGPRRMVKDAHILSRYAADRQGNFLSDWELEGAENPQFFVRMRLPNGRAGEYPVAAETYFNCAEGSFGEAELQGRWLGRFTPYIGQRPNA